MTFAKLWTDWTTSPLPRAKLNCVKLSYELIFFLWNGSQLMSTRGKSKNPFFLTSAVTVAGPSCNSNPKALLSPSYCTRLLFLETRFQQAGEGLLNLKKRVLWLRSHGLWHESAMHVSVGKPWSVLIHAGYGPGGLVRLRALWVCVHLLGCHSEQSCRSRNASSLRCWLAMCMAYSHNVVNPQPRDLQFWFHFQPISTSLWTSQCLRNY